MGYGGGCGREGCGGCGSELLFFFLLLIILFMPFGGGCFGLGKNE